MINKLKPISLTVIVLATICTNAHSQTWQRIPVFDYALVYSIVEAKDGTLIVDNARNLFASSDQGVSWHLLKHQTTSPQIDGEGNIYATANGRMIKSTNGGAPLNMQTWQIKDNSRSIQQVRASTRSLMASGIAQMMAVISGKRSSGQRGNS